MSGVRIPVNRFTDPNLRDALLKLEGGINEATARLDGLLTHYKGQAAPPTIPATVISDTLYTLSPANVSTSAAAVGTATTASPGDHVHRLLMGSGSGLNADLLDGLDSLAFIKANGTVPLTANWDAGNFAVTLGSVVGKSGDLSITPASGGQIAFSSSIASGGTNEGFLFTDTVARTTGSHLRIDNSAGDGLFIVQPATDAFRFGLASSGTVNYSSVWLVTGTTTRNISYANALDVSSFTNAGTGAACGMRLVPKSQYATAGGASTLQVGGGDILPQYVGTSYFGIHATQNEIYGLNLILGYVQGGGANTGSNIAGWGLMVGNVGTPVGMNRWAGVLIGARPTGIAATSCVGLHSVETINVSSGTKIAFDGAVTMAHSATQGSNTFTVYTEGDTYHVYNSGASQLDLFVDAAQAFHFDAGGAAGTSACYGNFAIPSSGILYFDGVGGNDYMQYAAGLLRTTIGGSAVSDFYSGGQELASGLAYRINAGRIILNESSFTHNPASAAIFTMTMNDAVLLTSTSSATTRTLLDVFRNNSTGTRAMFVVRDSTATALTVTSAAGVPQIGFYGVGAVSRPTAYTQTYSTADKTHAAMTSADLAINPATNIAPWGFSSQANAEAVQTEVNALRADVLDLKQLVNSVIDDLQALGLVS